MVEHLVRLKLALLRNGLRRSAWQVVMMLLGLLYGLGVLVVVVVGVVALAVGASLELQRTVLVAVGSLLVLGWAVLPLAAFGVDATLDPARFVTFPIPRRTLLTGLALAGLIGVPGVVTALGVLGSALVWWRHPAAVLVGLVAGVVTVALCVIASRSLTTALSPVLTGRRGREITGFAILLVLAGAYLGFGRLTSDAQITADEILGGLDRLSVVLGWTPLGAGWAAPADAAVGDWAAAGVRLAILVGTLAVLWLVWDRSLARALVRPPGGGAEGGASAKGLGWFARLPGTPVGAVAARSLTYWGRDPRYAMAIAAVPMMPLAMWAFGAGQGVVYLLPFLAAIMGWTVASDTSYDGTALWMHVAAPVRGLDDRVGRVVGAVAVMGPLVLGLAVLLSALSGHLDQLPAVLGASLGVFLTALGAGSVMSALVVLRTQQAGENPFATRQGGSVASVLSQMAGLLAAGALGLPEVILGGLALVWSAPVLGWVALLVGLVLGVLLLVVGVRWGGHLLDRRGPLLLQRLVAMT